MKLYLIGGFLGSGKTTAIQQAYAELVRNGVSAGVITNDQGVQLVDSRFMDSLDIPSREVTGGCFCCNYTRLEAHIRSLEQTEQPQIIFAESVGSCTDMVATVVRPLQRFYPDLDISVTVFADAGVLLPVLEEGKQLFEDSVAYIYDRQLEEADMLVVSKIDLLDADRRQEVLQLAQKKYPGKTVLGQDSFDKAHIRRWLRTLDEQGETERRALDVDYAVYGAGEARLAWLDEEMELHTDNGTAWQAGMELLHRIYEDIVRQGYPVGHLKALLDGGRRKIKISYTAGGRLPDTPVPENDPVDNVVLLLNARVQTEPDKLKQLVADAIKDAAARRGCRITSRKLSVFRPGFPRPTHRILD
ncbi:GTP-binding protein [Compostibacter hankyongensis]|uniref:GTP-binding protein n=1 Tax=Compostibacter hankyongensis TaxID=1007089 RepID=A0ABP8FT33_9BACT